MSSSPEPQLKLCDFGFARTVTSRGGQVLTDYVATRWYRAPELLLGSTDYGKAVDIWAIGCIMGELIDGQPLFPGESEIDQLIVIQKVMGALTPTQLEQYNRNPRFVGIKLPYVSKPETLVKRYFGKLSKRALSFIKGVLKMDPAERLSGLECLEHPYFEGLPLRERDRAQAAAAAVTPAAGTMPSTKLVSDASPPPTRSGLVRAPPPPPGLFWLSLFSCFLSRAIVIFISQSPSSLPPPCPSRRDCFNRFFFLLLVFFFRFQ